jgi:hypothetical protein
MHVLGRMDVEQAHRHHLDSRAVAVQPLLHGLADPILHLAALIGIEMIDVARRHDRAQSGESQAAHELVRLGQAIRIGDRVRHPVLHS